MHGKKIEGLLTEVELALKELSIMLQEVAGLEQDPAYRPDINGIMQTILSLEEWVSARKKNLKQGRQQYIKQIVEEELRIFHRDIRIQRNKP
jgi:hypothetical protein